MILKFFERKINSSIATFFSLGILCVILGIAVLVNEFFWRLFVAVMFFILAFIAFHIASRIQYVRDTMKKVFKK